MSSIVNSFRTRKNNVKVKKDGIEVEFPFVENVLQDKFQNFMLSLVLFETKIIMPHSYSEDYDSEEYDFHSIPFPGDDEHCHC